jgi:hypothetical protein
MMNKILEVLRGSNEPIDTGSLAASIAVNRTELFSVLNEATKDGKLVRHGLFVANGTFRPTLCFGWSCPID